METIELRPTESDDLAYVVRSEQDPENSPFVGQWTFAQHLAALSDPDISHLIIEQISNSQMVGYIILAGLSRPRHNIELRRIVITHKGQGFGRKALRLIKELAFERYHAQRLWLDVREKNELARKLYESEGFVIERRIQESVKVGDHLENLLILSMDRAGYQNR